MKILNHPTPSFFLKRGANIQNKMTSIHIFSDSNITGEPSGCLSRKVEQSNVHSLGLKYFVQCKIPGTFCDPIPRVHSIKARKLKSRNFIVYLRAPSRGPSI